MSNGSESFLIPPAWLDKGIKYILDGKDAPGVSRTQFNEYLEITFYDHADELVNPPFAVPLKDARNLYIALVEAQAAVPALGLSAIYQNAASIPPIDQIPVTKDDFVAVHKVTGQLVPLSQRAAVLLGSLTEFSPIFKETVAGVKDFSPDMVEINRMNPLSIPHMKMATILGASYKLDQACIDAFRDQFSFLTAESQEALVAELAKVTDLDVAKDFAAELRVSGSLPLMGEISQLVAYMENPPDEDTLSLLLDSAESSGIVTYDRNGRIGVNPLFNLKHEQLFGEDF